MMQAYTKPRKQQSQRFCSSWYVLIVSQCDIENDSLIQANKLPKHFQDNLKCELFSLSLLMNVTQVSIVPQGY